MDICSLFFLFLGILLIGLVYAKTDNRRISHYILFTETEELSMKSQ